MTTQYRFYSFVAALYISPLQCGLQTAHAVSQMHADLTALEEDQASFRKTPGRESYDLWATNDKTIIICNALNSQGVIEAHLKAKYFAEKLGLPTTIFHEDTASLNGAATAAAVVVPNHFYDAKSYGEIREPGFLARLFRGKNHTIEQGFQYTFTDGSVARYVQGTLEAEFISFLKSYRLA